MGATYFGRTSWRKSVLKVRFHRPIYPTNLMTNSPYKQMSHIFVWFVSRKFVVNQIGLLQTHTMATLRASLSSSLLQKCDGGYAPLPKVYFCRHMFATNSLTNWFAANSLRQLFDLSLSARMHAKM
jgi:hypothetical protein